MRHWLSEDSPPAQEMVTMSLGTGPNWDSLVGDPDS